MSHKEIFLEDINVTKAQVWKTHTKALVIKLMTPLYYVPDYIAVPENTKVNIRITSSIIARVLQDR